MTTVGELRRLLAEKSFLRLKRKLEAIDCESLAGCWDGFEGLAKLILFKLLKPAKALRLYERLSFESQYFLFCGFELQTIAPVLEDLSGKTCRLFHKLPEAYYDKMLRILIGVGEGAESGAETR